MAADDGVGALNIYLETDPNQLKKVAEGDFGGLEERIGKSIQDYLRLVGKGGREED